MQTIPSTPASNPYPRDKAKITPRVHRWVEEIMQINTSSLLGIHFGHYMAGTFNPNILIFNATMADILLKMGYSPKIFNATMADIPLKMGYSPKRWQERLNVMLEKSPGNFNIDIILLFKADLNANNKWLGRAVMWNAETLDLLANEQYSSRKNKAAVLQCLNKGLFYNLLCQ